MRISRGLAAVLSASVVFLSFMSGGQVRGTGSREESRDSLVVLLSSKSAQMVDVEGNRYRKVIGPARFLHNGTFLLCDTALWNVETQIIEAWGNVSILQEETVLTSDRLIYLIDDNLAQFRGSVVELTDKDHNTLRTRHLDYNTADSVAIFQGGASMRDKDGQIIESLRGNYDSKISTFLFSEDVNMFTDSIFVKTNSLRYESDRDFASFGSGTDVWKDDNMLSSDNGWYDRIREQFFFSDRVHIMSADQEGWCDSLFFHRLTSDVEMLGNAQITDTTRNVYGLAGRIEYVDSLSEITMTRKPAVISQTNEDGIIDTVYLGASKLVYYTLRMCDVDSTSLAMAQQRIEDLKVDPVGTFRKKAAEEAAKAAAEAAKDDPNYRPSVSPSASPAKSGPKEHPSGPEQPESKSGPVAPLPDSPAVSDSLSFTDSLAVTDSLAIADSLAVPALNEIVEQPDTSKVGFLLALGQVKVYKKDMQVSCDSLVYSDLDSLAQMFREPVIWQEGTRQYAADSVYVSVRNQAMDKAMLMSDAFITIQEDSTHFDQIKGTEMMAYFDEEGSLKRFDVLGGASALFYLEENEVLATVNKTDSKMLSATFANGEIQRIYYFEDAKNDGYPVVNLSEDERRLKGFRWNPERRPADRNAVTPLALRPGERTRYSARPRARFVQTDIYFPGYMTDVYKQIHVRDSLNKVRELERQKAEREAARLAGADTLAGDGSPAPDSLALAARKDSLSVGLDSLSVKTDTVAVSDTGGSASEGLSAKEMKTKERAEARKKKQDAQEARWKELDRRDEEKAKAREEKRLAKERKRKRKALADAARQAEKEARIIEKYRLRYEKRKSREDSK